VFEQTRLIKKWTDLALFGELDAIGKEVQQNLAESVWIAHHVLV